MLQGMGLMPESPTAQGKAPAAFSGNLPPGPSLRPVNTSKASSAEAAADDAEPLSNGSAPGSQASVEGVSPAWAPFRVWPCGLDKLSQALGNSWSSVNCTCRLHTAVICL